MVKSKIISGSDLGRFIEFNQRNNGATVSVEYLETARVRIFYDPSDEEHWLAGYAVNTVAPFRYLTVLSDDQRVTLLSEHDIREENMVEITMIVRDKSYRWNNFQRFMYFSRSIIDALATGRGVIFGGTVNPRLRDFMMSVLGKMFFVGSANFFGKQRHMWLFYDKKFNVIANLFLINIKQVKTYL